MTAATALAAYVLGSFVLGGLIGHYLAASDGDVVAENRLRWLAWAAGYLVRGITASLAVASLIYVLIGVLNHV